MDISLPSRRLVACTGSAVICHVTTGERQQDCVWHVNAVCVDPVLTAITADARLPVCAVLQANPTGVRLQPQTLVPLHDAAVVWYHEITPCVVSRAHEWFK